VTLTAFLPCRAGSQRVPRKNTRPFAGEPEGLLGIKLRQLLASPAIDAVLLSTNDPEVIAIGERHAADADGRLIVKVRPDHLCSSSTSTDEVIAYLPEVVPEGDVLWTHVTSPFFTEADYDAAISAYREAQDAGTHDSLMGVNELYAFLWNRDGPINYDRDVEKWPRTQTLDPLYEVNSSIFIAPVAAYRDLGDRVGERPMLHVVPKAQTVDIDWEEDFLIAAELWKLRGMPS
jgi:CMP-N-acetylneuraminic acid synthetase